MEAKPSYGYLEHFPALTYHYGLAFSELVCMPIVFIKLYIEKLPELLAQQQILQIEVSSFPHVKQDAQKSLMRKLELRANFDKTPSASEKLPDSPILMQQKLAGIGIGVKFVDVNGDEEGKEVSDA